jgi:hypothetical protein
MVRYLYQVLTTCTVVYRYRYGTRYGTRYVTRYGTRYGTRYRYVQIESNQLAHYARKIVHEEILVSVRDSASPLQDSQLRPLPQYFKII